jgi:uncharacterized membrane protein
MNEQEDIRDLQRQINELAAELGDSQQKLRSLQQRLNTLTGLNYLPEQHQQDNPSMTHQHPDDRHEWTFENFIGLRVIHLIGIVVLVVGLSLGVKYAIDRNLISEYARIGLAYGAGLVLYLLSWKLKKNYSGFSAILFSGAMASLYFTTYAAFVYYGMMSFALAFALMIGLTVFSVFMALRYNRQEIALLGLVGAYGIPFLISANTGRVDLFFSYIFFINLAVLFLSIKRTWKIVGRAAQAITWLLFLAWSTGWGAAAARQQPAWVGPVFMIAFFLLFMAIAFAPKIFRRVPMNPHDVHQVWLNNVALYVAALFVFSMPLQERSLATLTGLFAFFAAVQTWIFYYFRAEEKYLRTIHLIYSLLLAVLFVVFEWEGITVTLLWLLMAVLIFTWGVGAKSMVLRVSGMGLIGLTLLKLVALDSMSFSTVQKVIAYITLGILLLVVSFFYQKFRSKLFDEGMDAGTSGRR